MTTEAMVTAAAIPIVRIITAVLALVNSVSQVSREMTRSKTPEKVLSRKKLCTNSASRLPP